MSFPHRIYFGIIAVISKYADCQLGATLFRISKPLRMRNRDFAKSIQFRIIILLQLIGDPKEEQSVQKSFNDKLRPEPFGFGL